MKALIALLVAVPLLTLAEEPAPPGPTNPPSWSIGGGVTIQVAAASTLPSPLVLTGPGGFASLERRLGDATWLTLGGSAVVSNTDQPLPPATLGVTRDDRRAFQLEAGVRRRLTTPGAPVELSGTLAGQVGHATLDQEAVGLGVSTLATRATWLGVSAGLAVERELGPGLSLRIATPILSAAWAATRVEQDGASSGTGHSLDARLVLEPRLELRLAF